MIWMAIDRLLLPEPNWDGAKLQLLLFLEGDLFPPAAKMRVRLRWFSLDWWAPWAKGGTSTIFTHEGLEEDWVAFMEFGKVPVFI